MQRISIELILSLELKSIKTTTILNERAKAARLVAEAKFIG